MRFRNNGCIRSFELVPHTYDQIKTSSFAVNFQARELDGETFRTYLIQR